MKIILIRDYQGLGNLGEEKEVKNGYARNFLIPNKIALSVSHPEAQKFIKERKDKISKNGGNITKKGDLMGTSEKNRLVFKVKANKKKESYKAITSKEIAEALNIEAKKIKIKPINKIGENKIKFEYNGKEQEVLVVLEEIE